MENPRRPVLAFFRVAFGGAMLPYCARCVVKALHAPDYAVAPTSRVDARVLSMLVGAPTADGVFRRMVAMACGAALILVGSGAASRAGCLAFGVLQMGNALRDLDGMNNHDHLYWLIGLALASTDAHDARHSALSRCAAALRSARSRGTSNHVASRAAALILGLGSAAFLVMCNLRHGIGGWVAPVGMAGIWAMAGTSAREESEEGKAEEGEEVRGCGAWLVRTLLSAVYLYAALAKINDDWLSGRDLVCDLMPRGWGCVALTAWLTGSQVACPPS